MSSSWEQYETDSNGGMTTATSSSKSSDASTSIDDLDSEDVSAVEDITLRRHAANLDLALQCEFEQQAQWVRQLVEGDGRQLVRPNDRVKRRRMPAHLRERCCSGGGGTATDEFQARIRAQLFGRRGEKQGKKKSGQEDASEDDDGSGGDSSDGEDDAFLVSSSAPSLRRELIDLVVPEYCTALLTQLFSNVAPMQPETNQELQRRIQEHQNRGETENYDEAEEETAKLFQLVEAFRCSKRRPAMPTRETEEGEDIKEDGEDGKEQKRRRTETKQKQETPPSLLPLDPPLDRNKLIQMRRALRHAKRYDWHEDVVAPPRQLPITFGKRGEQPWKREAPMEHGAGAVAAALGFQRKGNTFEPIKPSPATGVFATAMSAEREVHAANDGEKEEHAIEARESKEEPPQPQQQKKHEQAPDFQHGEDKSHVEEDEIKAQEKKKNKNDGPEPQQLPSVSGKKKHQFNDKLVNAINASPMRSSLSSLVLEVEGSDLAVAEAGRSVREAFRVLRDELRQFQRLTMERRTLMLMVDVHTLLTQETFEAAEKLLSEGIKACDFINKRTKKRLKKEKQQQQEGNEEGEEREQKKSVELEQTA